MHAARREVLQFETNWLRSFADVYESSDASFAFSTKKLRGANVSLVDVRMALRRREVIYAEKLVARVIRTWGTAF